MGERPALPSSSADADHPTRRRSYRPVLIAAAVVAIALAAGAVVTGGRNGDRAPAAGPAPATELAAAPLDGGAPVVEAKTAPLSPGELALQLQALLGQHTVLAADMMRGRLRNDPDLAQAANAALGKNTDAMGKLVGGRLRQPGRDAVHAAVVHPCHRAVQLRARAGRRRRHGAEPGEVTITRFETDLAEFFVAAAQGRLPAAVAARPRSPRTSSTCSARPTRTRRRTGPGLGQALPAGLRARLRAGQVARRRAAAAEQAATSLGTPRWRLRLGARPSCSASTSSWSSARCGPGSPTPPDFRAAAAAVNGNTTDLAGASTCCSAPPRRAASSSCGPTTSTCWSATRPRSPRATTARAARIGGKLNGFEGQLAAFLNTATGNKIAAAALAKALQSHDAMLRRQVDAFVAKDYKRSHDIAYSTYQEMYGLAGQLATAFGVTVASRLPVGAAQTGRGGTAPVIGGR